MCSDVNALTILVPLGFKAANAGNYKIKLTNTKPFSLKSVLSISMILLFVLILHEW